MHDPDEEVELGYVTVPSGTLVITDMGYLGSWSGSRPPSSVPPEITDPDLRASVVAAQDFRVVGRDAESAARAIDLQSLTFLYDIPRHGVATMLARFKETVDRHGFDARLEAEHTRVSHRERARRAAAAGGADFTVDGVWSVAIGHLPEDRPLKVVGHKHDYGTGVGERWVDVTVVVAGGLEASARRRVGQIGVDWARIILIDADALGFWVHEDALDGRADVAYWGRDVDLARVSLGGDRLEDGTFGWKDQPAAEALVIATRAERWRSDSNRRLMVDYRPHSHHHEVMEQIRRGNEFGVGAIDIGGARAVAFHTSWGDGVFPVFREGTDRQVTAVRVVLGDDDRKQRTQAVLSRRESPRA